MIPLIIVALVILMIIAPQYKQWAFLGIVIALVTGEKSKPGTNAEANAITWRGHEYFADNYTEGVKSDNKLAKALTYCFTLNGNRSDFDKIVEEVTPEQFVDAMHAPVDYLRNHEIYGGSWLAEGAGYPIYPFDVLFLELSDLIDSAHMYGTTTDDEYFKSLIEHQEAARHYIRTYLQMLKLTRRQPPSDDFNNSENQFAFGLYETQARVRKFYAPSPWRGQPNVFDDIVDMYERFKNPRVLGG